MTTSYLQWLLPNSKHDRERLKTAVPWTNRNHEAELLFQEHLKSRDWNLPLCTLEVFQDAFQRNTIVLWLHMRLNQRKIRVKCQEKRALWEWRSCSHKRSRELYGRSRSNKKKRDAEEPSSTPARRMEWRKKKGGLDVSFQESLKVHAVWTSLLLLLLAKENAGASSQATKRCSRCVWPRTIAFTRQQHAPLISR